eukprot:327575-Pyramimonas_sp.AAC.2
MAIRESNLPVSMHLVLDSVRAFAGWLFAHTWHASSHAKFTVALCPTPRAPHSATSVTHAASRRIGALGDHMR